MRRVYGTRARSAFTLVELLVVMGIIVALISVLLPVVFSVQKKAEVARMRQDLDTIAVALEEYKKVFGDYPRVADPTKVTSPHEALLVTYLLGPNGQGIRDAGTVGPANTGGRKWGPYLPVDKFKVQVSGTQSQLLDRNGVEIQYYPRYNTYDVRNTFAGGYLVGNVVGSPGAARAMYRLHDGIAGDGVSDHLNQTLYMLGDGGDNPTQLANNKIDGTETLSFSGPFMLISAGPDTKWGLNGGIVKKHSDVDDVYNFGR